MAEIKFGTDGWRAVVAEDYTFVNVRRVARAVAEYLKASGTPAGPVLIGYDTRFGSEWFAEAAAQVLSAAGCRVMLGDAAAPTPAVSLGVIQRGCAGGIVITASHNPARWNGFKYKPDYGGSASPQVIAQIEAALSQVPPDVAVAAAPGTDRGSISSEDLRGPYAEQLARLVDLGGLRSWRGRVAYDAMFGTGAGLLQQLLDGGSVEVVGINQERNPLFPGIHAPEPIGRNLEKLQHTVRETGAQLGVATDGDADRLGVIDEHGRYVNQLQVYALLALYLLEVRGLRGPLVKTLSQSYMVDRLGELYGVPVHDTPVGFKYVGPTMTETGAIMGGEESGGYGFKGHIPERDGTLAALYILDLVRHMDRPLSQVVKYLEDKVGSYFYDRRDLTFDPARREEILERLGNNPPEEILGRRVARFDTRDGFKYVLENGTWLLIRFSGTEPVIRIYTETDSEGRVSPMLDTGRSLAGL